MSAKTMTILGEKEFLKNAHDGKVSTLVTKLSGSRICLSMVLSGLSDNQPVCFLESAGGSAQLTEYSFLGTDPLAIFIYRNSSAQILLDSKCCYCSGNAFLLLRDLLNRIAPSTQPDLPIPFWGGAMGFLGYDAGRYIEKLPVLARDDLGLPEFYLFFPQTLFVADHETRDIYMVVNKLVGANHNKALNEAKETMDQAHALLASAGATDGKTEKTVAEQELREPQSFKAASNFDQPAFEQAVEKIQAYIRAGDVYQVNISQRLETPFPGDPVALYERLKGINPSPFASYLNCTDFQLVSSSPERLIMLRDGIAQTRPIAGTRRRGEDIEEDGRLSADLLLDKKEQAEHIMLVDLERNDLGRVCEYGSVEANELMILEKYSHVIHIVSNVRGMLHSGKDQFDLIRAMFPGGTITGCPKVRCMEIIEEVEPARRGPYTGSIGYFGFNGNMDMNIIIRTILLKKGRAYLQVGAGIVFDSQPAREYFETLSKADALLAALGCAKEVKKWETLPI